MTHLYIGMLFSNKKTWTTDTCNTWIIFKIIMLSREAIHKMLFTIWAHLYDIKEKEKLQGQKSVQDFRDGVRGLTLKGHKRNFYILSSGSYMAVYFCQYLNHASRKYEFLCITKPDFKNNNNERRKGILIRDNSKRKGLKYDSIVHVRDYSSSVLQRHSIESKAWQAMESGTFHFHLQLPPQT